MTIWHRLKQHLHVALMTLHVLRPKVRVGQDREDVDTAIDAIEQATAIVRRLSDSGGDSDMADIETQELKALKDKAAKRSWDTTTLKQVQAIWALAVGSAVIFAAIFYVLPHLAEDGLIRDDIWLIAAFSLFGSMIAFPSAVKQGIGNIVLAIKSWRGKSGDA